MPLTAQPDIADRLWDLSHRFKARMRDGLAAETPGLPPFQAKALSAIGRMPGVQPSQLVERSGRDKAQVARVLKDLEDQGLITRTAHASDRRTHCLSLTQTGEQLFTRLQDNRARVASQMMRGLTAEEQKLIADMLERMAGNLSGEHSQG